MGSEGKRIHELEQQLADAREKADNANRAFSYLLNVVFVMLFAFVYILDKHIDGYETAFTIAETAIGALTICMILGSIILNSARRVFKTMKGENNE